MNKIGPLILIASSLSLPVSDVSAEIVGIQAEDMRGRMVDTARLQGKILLLGFATEDTSSELTEWQTEIGFHSRVTLEGGDDVFVVAVADASPFPWIVRPVVKMKLNGIHEKANARLAKRFEEHQMAPPSHVNDIIHFVPDWKGEIVGAFSLAEDMDTPHLILVGRDGVVAGRYSSPSKATNERILARVKELLGQNPS